MSSVKREQAKEKLARIPVKIAPTTSRERLPRWLYTKLPKAGEHNPISEVKNLLRKKKLYSVCEEASCPNLADCFSRGTASYMIMGDTCTRRCTFCDVKHGRPAALDQDEPENLSDVIQQMQLKYVVITSVDRDDLRDGGAHHFASCIAAIRRKNPGIEVEILVPDFRGKSRLPVALEALSKDAPDVFNHNIETIARLYKTVRPGSDYAWSLRLLEEYKALNPHIPTKSGMMLGLGESDAEVLEAMEDLRKHNVDMLTLGQYLQPSNYHHPIKRYVKPETFAYFKEEALKMGFSHVASGPNVRSSYHADVLKHTGTT